MPAPDWVRPLAGLDDVPIERDRIGAMGAGSGQITRHSLFKPYVYRGWGIDLFEDLPSVRTAPAPKRKRKRKRKRKPRSRYHWTPPEPEPKPEPKTEHKPEPKTEHKPIRPSPGWQPMTGSDLDALLDEVFDE